MCNIGIEDWKSIIIGLLHIGGGVTTSQRSRTVALLCSALKLQGSLSPRACSSSLSISSAWTLSYGDAWPSKIPPMPYRCRPASNLRCRACINKEAPSYMRARQANVGSALLGIEMSARSAVIAPRQRSSLHRSPLAAESIPCWHAAGHTCLPRYHMMHLIAARYTASDLM